MGSSKTRIFRINFTRDKITFIKSDTSSTPANLSPDGIKLELTVGRIFHKALNKTRVEGIFEKNDFEFLGGILFNLLCLREQQDARDFVYNELAMIFRDANRGLIVLEFDEEAADLAMLPWEYLQIEKNTNRQIPSFYLGAQRDFKFDLIRFIKKNSDISIDYSPVQQKKLIVVNVICDPVSDKLNTQDFMQSFEQLGKDFKSENGEEMIETWRVENPSVESFIAEMKKLKDNINGQYILHFYGHARMDREEPEIAFIDSQGKKQWVSHVIFENLFGQNQKYRQPLIFVMQACESGQLNSSGKGLAVSLINKDIPFVLAMQNEVTQDTSIAFFKKFYEALLSGQDFFRAVTTSRVYLGCEYLKHNPDNELEHYDSNAFGTPVVFSSTVIPVRFFPEKEDKEAKEDHRMLVCTKCGTRYVFDSGREFCIKGSCNGRLEIEKIPGTEVPGSTAQLDHNRTKNLTLDNRAS
jgi:hypothetical protein